MTIGPDQMRLRRNSLTCGSTEAAARTACADRAAPASRMPGVTFEK